MSSEGETTWNCAATLEGHSKSILSVAFHPEGVFLCTAIWDMTINVWMLNKDKNSARHVFTLSNNSNIKHLVFYSSGMFLAVGCRDGSVKFFDFRFLTRGQRLKALMNPPSNINHKLVTKLLDKIPDRQIRDMVMRRISGLVPIVFKQNMRNRPYNQPPVSGHDASHAQEVDTEGSLQNETSGGKQSRQKNKRQ